MRTTRFATACVIAILAGIGAALGADQGPEKFIRTRQGFEALVDAVRANDEQSLKAMLGPEGDALLYSGPGGREAFLARYGALTEREQETARRVVLVGNDGRKLPIPMVKKDWSGWTFDTRTALAQLQQRRIARNETADAARPR